MILLYFCTHYLQSLKQRDISVYKINERNILISNFRHVLVIVCSLLGVSPASDFLHVKIRSRGYTQNTTHKRNFVSLYLQRKFS
jgi:hypothetical protein